MSISCDLEISCSGRGCNSSTNLSLANSLEKKKSKQNAGEVAPVLG